MRSRSSPPYDLAAAGVTRHVVYLSAADAVFVFEGSEVERRLHELVTAPSQSARTSALEEWRDIVDGPGAHRAGDVCLGRQGGETSARKPDGPATSRAR